MGSSVTFDIKFDISPLVAIANGLNTLPERIAAVSISTVNLVAASTIAKTVISSSEQVNVPKDYVQSHFTQVDATLSEPFAIITASDSPRSLVKYTPVQLSKPASSYAKGGGVGKVRPGYRADGVSVNVKSGAAHGVLQHGFFMVTNSGLGIYTRSANGQIKKRFGPSVDQIFKANLESTKSDVENELQKVAIEQLTQLDITP